MRKLTFLLSTAMLLLLHTHGSAQNIFFDGGLPTYGDIPNYGFRATVFQPVDPLLDIGFVVRVMELNYDQGDVPNLPGNGTQVRELSAGLAIRYFFFRNASSGDGLYVNPNVEVNSFSQDEGIDMSAMLGYTKKLSDWLRINGEIGARSRLFGYQYEQAYQDRFIYTISIGLGFDFVKMFGSNGGAEPILTQ